jgi:hypothetical protein
MDDPAAAVEVAIATLCRELGCQPAELVVDEVKPVTWPDSALGCPQPGRMYAQVLTPGYQIRLARQGESYVMHTDRGHRAVRCQDRGIMHDLGAE